MAEAMANGENLGRMLLKYKHLKFLDYFYDAWSLCTVWSFPYD
jgi:hypothetical protein